MNSPTKNFDRPQLLVSVRNVEEAEIALAQDVDWIDLKDPGQGPLGAPDLLTASQVAAVLSSKQQRSVALGELRNLAPHVARQYAELFPVVKVGLSGLRSREWREPLLALNQELGEESQLVPVLYADWDICEGLSPEEVLEAAGIVAASRILIDTFSKSGQSAPHILGNKPLAQIISQCTENSLSVVLAGNLKLQDLNHVSRFQVEAFGVRGAVCDGERTESISPELINCWVQRLQKP